MGKWKNAFVKSLDPEIEPLQSFEFGPPATAAELAALSAAVSAKLPEELVDLLREFNGIKRPGLLGDKEPYFFSTQEMPSAGEYYRNWDCDTTLCMEWFKNVVFVCQENGYSAMWAFVIKPLEGFKYADIVSFDHDRIGFAETATDLFTVNYENLLQLVQARFKDAG
jgi:hypothetical protein